MRTLLESLRLHRQFLLIGGAVLISVSLVVALAIAQGQNPIELTDSKDSPTVSSGTASPTVSLVPSETPTETAPPADTEESATDDRTTGQGAASDSQPAVPPGSQAVPPAVPALPVGPPPPPIPQITWVGITASAAACPERPDLGASSFQIYITAKPDAGAVSADGYLGNLRSGHIFFYENGMGHGDVWLSDFTVAPGESGQFSVYVRVFNSVGEADDYTAYFNVAC